MCVGTSSSGRAGQLFRLDRFSISASYPFRLSVEMASRPSSSGADAAEAFAAYAAMAGIDLVAPTTSPSVPTASPLDDTPATGVGIDAEPPVLGEPSATALPSSGGALGVETAAPLASGEPALVELTTGEEDIAPPVMGVPSSSEDEEELLADSAGAPLVGAPPAIVDVAAVGVQTEHITPIIAFDAHDVAVQTVGEVIFSSFVGDTSQEALATAIRALSREDRDRLVGALRLAEDQPLVDVAPSGGAGDPSSSTVPTLDLLDLTPAAPHAPSGVVDPGPSPATARTFWEEQDATAVAELAAARPVPDDDIDAEPPTSLELFLIEKDAAAGAKAPTGTTSSGTASSSSAGPGPKKPFKKAPPPALVPDEPKVQATKAPPMPYPDKPIRFLDAAPAKPKPTVKRPPAGAITLQQGAASGTIAGQQSANAPAVDPSPPVAKPASTSGGPQASSSPGGATAEAREVVGGGPAPSDEYARRQAFIRQEQMARSRGGPSPAARWRHLPGGP